MITLIFIYKGKTTEKRGFFGKVIKKIKVVLQRKYIT
jgi:hypothetical protein